MKMPLTIPILRRDGLKASWLRRAAGTAVAAGFLAGTLGGHADSPVTMAPPMGAPDATATADASANVSQDSVFNWAEVPQNQQVTLTRAVFDQGGYQLYDTVGETIVIPFTNHDLYVMKFARSSNGHMYFVNTGSAPILYVPKNGYLENATVPGARWYPFSQDFHPANPVYLGIAPSWSAFVGMGWYSGMTCWGGYWGNAPFIGGGLFLATPGLLFVIGGHSYHGWDPYFAYSHDHPAPYRIAYFHRDVYRWAGRSYGGDRVFAGTGRQFAARNGHPFRGAGRSFGGGRWAHHTFGGGGHDFGGFGGGHGFGGGGGHWGR